MLRNSKKYSINVDQIGTDIAISISVEIGMSPELIDLILRDLRSDARDFNETRILAEIIRDPAIIYSLCQLIEQVKNQDNRYKETNHEDLNNQEPTNQDGNLYATNYTSNDL
ncbi:MAG: hypothetical protein WBB28_06580 [Crinalium sp.]